MKTDVKKVSRGEQNGRNAHNTIVYVRQHWRLYVFFLMPALLLTIIFKYLPMGGILIAFKDYNPIKGIWASEWVGFKHFQRFLTSPNFIKYLINTLKLSIFGLLWGFPIPILLAFLLNRLNSVAVKKRYSWHCICRILSQSSYSVVWSGFSCR